MRRILVIGSGGAGKSTVALQVGERLGLPVIHLDVHFWQPGWKETPKAQWEETVQQLITRDGWVMDGNYGGTLDARLAVADTVIFLDMPRLLCLWRVVRRWVRFHGRSRPDIAPDCPERLRGEFIYWILGYPKTRRPGILDKLRAVEQEKQIVVLRTPEEVTDFLNNLP